jgi:O-antigen/teichoic acid export membrane protein
VVAVLSIMVIISGFESTRMLQANRNLAVARITMIEVATQGFSLVVMLIWGLIDRSIWALVASSIAGVVLRTALSFLAMPGASNRWRWDRAAFMEIIHVGKWIFLSSMSFFFAGSGDRIMLGGLVDAATMGTYAIAFLFFSAADTILERIVVDVSFPALGEVKRNHPERLKNTYYRFHAGIAGISYFATGVLAVSGHTLIDTLYDPRYLLAGHTLQILSVALLAIPFRIATIAFLLFIAADLFFWLNLVRLVTLFIAIPTGFALFGYDGALWGIVASHFANLPLIIWASRRFGLFDLRRELLILPVLLAGAAVGLAANHVVAAFH